MKFVVDVNLSRNWLPALQGEGHDAVYWNDLGDPSAADSEIMDWARVHDAVVLTCDLDFSAILAASSATKPSVVQFRPGRHRPALLLGKLLLALRRYQSELQNGALVSIDQHASRVHHLPLTD